MSDGEAKVEVIPELLEQRITTLAELGDLTADLVATAKRLAERLPMLGTAPPAVHLAMRLREAAGGTGLAGEVEATEREVKEYQRTLGDAKRRYQEHDEGSREDLHKHDNDDERTASGPGRSA